MKNNYDRIAPYYDFLSRMVFFSSQVKAQVAQLRFIPAGSNVLIVGGGTGWVLEEIAKIQPAGLNICYVEISEKMLDLSKKRNVAGNTIQYVRAAAEDFVSSQKFDVIISAFLFDNFSADRIDAVFTLLDQMLQPKGYWLFCDFYYTQASGKKWQHFLLKTMYFFFKHISDVEAKALINTEHLFASKDYQMIESKFYFKGFIKAVTYQKDF